MIAGEVFTKEWIESKSKVLGSGKRQADSELLEKVTKSFHLLECMVESGLDFIFKGGTSLLLIDKPHRFSIDIDIIIEKKTDDIEKTLTGMICSSHVFTRYEKVLRKNNSDISKQHYKFYYSSVLNNSEKYILIVEENIFRDVLVHYSARYEYCPNTEEFTTFDEMLETNDISFKMLIEQKWVC